jgi:hypothetical protein
VYSYVGRVASKARPTILKRKANRKFIEYGANKASVNSVDGLYNVSSNSNSSSSSSTSASKQQDESNEDLGLNSGNHLLKEGSAKGDSIKYNLETVLAYLREGHNLRFFSLFLKRFKFKYTNKISYILYILLFLSHLQVRTAFSFYLHKIEARLREEAHLNDNSNQQQMV